MYIKITRYIQSPDHQCANQIHFIRKLENIFFCFLCRTLPNSGTRWTPTTASVKRLVLRRGAKRHDFEIYTVYLEIWETDDWPQTSFASDCECAVVKHNHSIQSSTFRKWEQKLATPGGAESWWEDPLDDIRQLSKTAFLTPRACESRSVVEPEVQQTDLLNFMKPSIHVRGVISLAREADCKQSAKAGLPVPHRKFYL